MVKKEIDIFEGVNFEQPEWFKFTNIGDSIQGTFVDKFHTTDGYGNAQTVYQLKKGDKITNLGFRDTKWDIHQDMKEARLGQIIGFKYIENRKIKNKAGQPVTIKVYRAAHDPNVVDEAWIKENPNAKFSGERPRFTRDSNSGSAEKKAEADFQSIGNKAAEVLGVEEVAAPASVTVEDKLAVITKLAKDKFGVADANVRDVVMEKTQVAFIAVNYDKIISMLSGM